jgi:hypothetical protein
MTTSGATEVVSAPGELQHLAPSSIVLRRFTTPGASINTGAYDFTADRCKTPSGLTPTV